MSLTLAALMLTATFSSAFALPPQQMSANQGSHGRYYGKPDLALTAAMIGAGGGASAFSSQKLFVYLAGDHAKAEAESLTKRYGANDVGQFFKTFDEFVKLAVVQVQKDRITMPSVEPPTGPVLAQQLYKAGVMPDLRYDVGYMLEHLLSRPMHITLMQEVNDSPAFGPQKNAQFHVILTAAMKDLHAAYGG
jgi:hypothetical protein